MPGYDQKNNTQKLPNTIKPINFNFNINIPPPNLVIPKNIVGTNTNNDFLHNENSTQVKDYMKLMMNITSNLDASCVPNLGHINPFVGCNGQLSQNINDINESESEESEELGFVPEKLPPTKTGPWAPQYTKRDELQTANFTKYLSAPQNKMYSCLLTDFRLYLKGASNQLRQPSREDIIDYLGHAVFMFKKTNKYNTESDDKAKEWLTQIKHFFAWTSANHMYKNIASDISPRDVINKSIEYQTNQETEERLKSEEAKQKLRERVDRIAARIAKRQASAKYDRNEARKIQRIKLIKTQNQQAAEDALNTTKKPAKDIPPQIIDPKWFGSFIESSNGQVVAQTFDNINIIIGALQSYINEFDIDGLTKANILKFITIYRDCRMFSSIQYNRYILRKFFKWLLKPENESSQTVSSDICSLVASYTEIKCFERQTAIKGNKQLETASFNVNWFDQFWEDMKKAGLPSSYNVQQKYTKALQQYLTKNVSTLRINPSHILDFCVVEKSNILEESLHKYLATYQGLFKWTAIKENTDGSMYYPDIMGLLPRRGILGQLIPILRDEYDRQTAIGKAPQHPTSKYFEDFMRTISNPDDGATAVNFENFINYLKVLKNIHIDSEDIEAIFLNHYEFSEES